MEFAEREPRPAKQHEPQPWETPEPLGPAVPNSVRGNGINRKPNPSRKPLDTVGLPTTAPSGEEIEARERELAPAPNAKLFVPPNGDYFGYSLKQYFDLRRENHLAAKNKPDNQLETASTDTTKGKNSPTPQPPNFDYRTAPVSKDKNLPRPTFKQQGDRLRIEGTKGSEQFYLHPNPKNPDGYVLTVIEQGRVTMQGTFSRELVSKLDLHGNKGNDIIGLENAPDGLRVYGDQGNDTLARSDTKAPVKFEGGPGLDQVFLPKDGRQPIANRELVPETPVQQFQRELKENAVERLQQNQARLTKVQSTYQNTQPSNGQWNTLRTLSARDQQLKQLQDQTSRELMTLAAKKEFSNSPLGRLINQTPLGGALGLPKSDPINNGLLLNIIGASPQDVDPTYREQFTNLRTRLELLYTVRQEMRAVHPALAVIDTAKAAALENTPENNALLYRQMSGGFEGMREGMAKLSAEVTKDPSKALLFDALVPKTLGMFKSPQEQQQIQQWLKQQQDKDAALKLIGGLGTAGMTVGGFLAGPLGWGVNVARGLFLGGSILGAATAAYEFPQLQMMDLAAKAGEAGGDKLTNQTPEEARMNLILGYGNLALAGLDGVMLAPAVVAKLMKVPSVVRAAGSMTQAQSRVLVNSLSRLSGDVTDAVVQRVAQAIRGGATEVELPGVGRIKLSELDVNQPMRMQGKGPGSGEYKKPKIIADLEKLPNAKLFASDQLEHVIFGNQNRAGKFTGWHHFPSRRPGEKVRTIDYGPNGLEKDSHGVYRAAVEASFDNGKTWVQKTAVNHTFFPNEWSRERVVNEVASAFKEGRIKNKPTDSPSYFQGRSESGVLIEGYIDSSGQIKTAYPLYGQ